MRHSSSSFWLILVISGLLLRGSPVARAEPPAGTLCVMTCNLRYASPTPPDAWPQRRPLMSELTRGISPDILGTFNNFEALRSDGVRIDWILSRGAVNTDWIEINTFQRGGQFPSDHCPVVAWLRLSQKK